MDYTLAAVVCVGGMLFLLMLGIPIAYSLGFISVIVGVLAFGDAAVFQRAGGATFQMLFKLSWTPLPLFMLLACIISETTIGADLFLATRKWLSRIPGGLLVASIMGQAAMSAALGASTPTIIAMGKVAEPEFKKNQYNKPFAIGALVCGGVLGPLIPPSATMIIFAVISNVPLGKLFIAGLVPGILLALMLSAVPVIMCWRKPSLGPPLGPVPWKERVISLKGVWPIIVVMVAILGSIYMGIATPTEAGGVGCFVVLIIAVGFYRLRFKGLFRAMKETAVLNGMILIVIIAASFFTYIIGSSTLAKSLYQFVISLQVPHILVVVSIMILLIILGCFIDGITIMMLTVPFFVPLLTNLGFNPLWIGVLYVVNMEIGLITPPMGLNLFITRNTFKLGSGELLRGILPFLCVLILFLAVLVAFPDITLWLPSMMRK